MCLISLTGTEEINEEVEWELTPLEGTTNNSTKEAILKPSQSTHVVDTSSMVKNEIHHHKKNTFIVNRLLTNYSEGKQMLL